MRIQLIRHFKTAGNIQRRYIGRSDEALVLPVAITTPYKPAEIVITSPMRRCIETSRFIYPKTPMISCDKMRECDFGAFEGKTYEELKDLPAYIRWLDSKGEIAPPDGEGASAFKKRCIAGFEEMIAVLIPKAYQAVSMVVHGGVIMAIMAAFNEEGRDFYQWQVGNGEGYSVLLDEQQWHQGKKRLMEIEKI